MFVAAVGCGGDRRRLAAAAVTSAQVTVVSLNESRDSPRGQGVLRGDSFAILCVAAGSLDSLDATDLHSRRVPCYVCLLI